MATPARSDHLAAFYEGSGVEQPMIYECHECGYTSPARRNFRKDGDERVCHTGHFRDEEGRLRRVRNPYAPH